MTAVRVRSPQDLAGGLTLVVIALVAGMAATDLPFGRTARMGPGWFPLVLSGLVGLFGLIIAARAFGPGDGDRLEPWSLARIVPVMAGILWFAFTVRSLGLVAAGVGLIAVSSLAAPDFRFRSTLIFGAAVVAFSALLFPVLLGLPLPIWPRL